MARHRNGYPVKIERSYYRQLGKLVRSWQVQANKMLDKIKPYVTGGTKMLTDADNSADPDWTHAVQQALDLFTVSVSGYYEEQKERNIAMQFVYAVDKFSDTKTTQRRGIITMKVDPVAINPFYRNPKLREYAKSKIIENTNLIQTMRQRYINQLQGDVFRLINQGSGISDLSHAISNRTGMALRHADLIATDQTGKILSQVDAYRNQQSGSTKYIWRSMEDGRVRPKHRELDGKVFKYDDPNGGDNGMLPGQPIRCRCYQDPVD